MAEDFEKFRGRTVDLLVLHPESYAKRSKVAGSFLDESDKSRACTGVQKAVQHWTMEFFTERNEEGEGTTFPAAMRGGRLYSDIVIRQEFNIAAIQAIDNLSDDYDDDTPEDEQITSVEIKSLTVQKGQFTIACEFSTLAGVSADLIMPVSLAPG